MKYILLSLFLVGCSTRNTSTVFFKEDDSTLINLEGANCQQSGLIVDEKKHTLTEYYTNCNVHKIRKLKDYEPKQWGIK